MKRFLLILLGVFFCFSLFSLDVYEYEKNNLLRFTNSLIIKITDYPKTDCSGNPFYSFNNIVYIEFYNENDESFFKSLLNKKELIEWITMNCYNVDYYNIVVRFFNKDPQVNKIEHCSTDYNNFYIKFKNYIAEKYRVKIKDVYIIRISELEYYVESKEKWEKLNPHYKICDAVVIENDSKVYSEPYAFSNIIFHLDSGHNVKKIVSDIEGDFVKIFFNNQGIDYQGWISSYSIEIIQ